MTQRWTAKDEKSIKDAEIVLSHKGFMDNLSVIVYEDLTSPKQAIHAVGQQWRLLEFASPEMFKDPDVRAAAEQNRNGNTKDEKVMDSCVGNGKANIFETYAFSEEKGTPGPLTTSSASFLSIRSLPSIQEVKQETGLRRSSC